MSVSLGVNSADYKCLKQIGSGFGGLTSIWLARYKDSTKDIVIKKTYLDISDSKKIDLMRHEVHLSRILSHPNVLPSLGAFVCGNELWTISPFMPYGSCDSIMKAGFPNGLSEAAISYILRDVLKALDNIHRMGYIHRAIKASHILINANGTACVTGLRESHCLSPDGYNHIYAYDFPIHAVASVPWLAPEVLEQNILGYDYRSDIYSVGITAIELAYGIEPHQNITASQVLLAKLQGNDVSLQKLPKSNISPSFGVSDMDLGSSVGGRTTIHGTHENLKHKKFSLSFCQFVNSCLQIEPDNRPSAGILLNHAFVKYAKKKVKETLPELLLPVLPKRFDNTDGSQLTNVATVTEKFDNLTFDSWDF